MKLYILTYQAISLLSAPKINTDVLWKLTFLFAAIALVYFIAIFFFRNKISAKSKKTSALKAALSPMISECIFYDERGTKEEKSIYVNHKVEIRDMLKDDFKRKTISAIVLELQKDVSGAAQQRLYQLFQDLDLHKDSYKKLHSWRWELISTGIQELTRMEVHDAYSFLSKFVNDKRATIRKQAEIAVVTLNPEGINFFLDTTRNRISEWQQLKLIEVLSNKTDFVAPSFKAWLVSKNKYVVLFALRLIKYYEQNDANTSIIELVKHRDDQIKQEAIDCIKAFHMSAAIPTLKQVFWACSTDIKIAILDAISNVGTIKDFPFLQSIDKKERNYSVTSKALSAINTIIPDSVLPTEGITDISNTIIPEDIIAKEMIATMNQNSSKKQQEIRNSKEPTQNNSTAVQGLEQRLSDTVRIDSPAQKYAEIEPDFLNKKDTNTINENSKEVKFSTNFLPLVTKPKSITKEELQQMETRINNIEVSYENAYEKYIPNTQEMCFMDPKNIEVIPDPGFLPLVVSNEVKKEKEKDLSEIEIVFEQVFAPKKTEETAIDTQAHQGQTIDANEINVVFEQVVATKEIEELGGDAEINPAQDIDVNEIELVFEQVIASKEKDVNEIEVNCEILEVVIVEKEKVLENIEVVFEEVLAAQVELSFENENNLNEKIDFEINFNNGQPPLQIPKIEASDLVFPKAERGAENLKKGGRNEREELPSWLLNKMANEGANYNNREHLKTDGPAWREKESQMMGQIQDYLKNAPSVDYMNNDISDQIRLLDDIELFGDEREIPLLQELIQKEDKIEITERIEGLMKRFMGTDVYGQSPDNSPPYSIFEELFRNCDTQSKLILLDEIVAVGDEKEVYFLEQLIEDPIKEIRKKAASSLKTLKERVSNVSTEKEGFNALKEPNEDDQYEHLINSMELSPPKETDEPSYFQIDFEIDSEVDDEKIEEEMEKDEKGFLKFFAKFIKKTNLL